MLPLKLRSGYPAFCLLEFMVAAGFNASVVDGSLLPLFLKELIFWPFLKCLFIFKQEASLSEIPCA